MLPRFRASKRSCLLQTLVVATALYFLGHFLVRRVPLLRCNPPVGEAAAAQAEEAAEQAQQAAKEAYAKAAAAAAPALKKLQGLAGVPESR